MKKTALLMALVTILLFSLTGCGNKAEIFISVNGIENYEMVEIPTDVVNFSHTEDGIYVTVKKNGKYEFVIKDTEGKEYSFTLIYQDKKAEVSSDSDINVTISMK